MQAINETQFQEIQNTIKNELLTKIEQFIRPDQGTCVMGEGVDVLTKFKRERRPRHRMIFRQTWTQGDQPKALNELIRLLKEKYPDCDFSYNCGMMD